MINKIKKRNCTYTHRHKKPSKAESSVIQLSWKNKVAMDISCSINHTKVKCYSTGSVSHDIVVKSML